MASLGQKRQEPASGRLLQSHNLAGSQDQSQRDRRDHYFSQRAHDERTYSLLLHLLEIDPQTNSRKREQERPARQVRQAADLVFVEDAQARQQRDQQKSQHKLGKLLPQERRLAT